MDIRSVVRWARRSAAPFTEPFRQREIVRRGAELKISAQPSGAPPTDNPLRKFSDNKSAGHGLWKWDHYFDIYHRHFSRFRGTDVHILEIGIFSGGSLEMWRDYFGPAAHIYGVDIQPACKAYECPNTSVFIGDQGDRAFWQHVRTQAPRIDIVIDDGSHWYPHQAISIEELLPHVRPGGVYLCEDLHGEANDFATYVSGMCNALNAHDSHDDGPKRSSPANAMQSRVNSIHSYPYCVVVELNQHDVPELFTIKRGTIWQPFLK